MFIINNKNNNNKQRKNMNNFKKIGLTALAASLVSTSVFAGELTATGAASITAEGVSGEQLNGSGNTGFSMANSVTFNGSTELDNGMTVSMSFELDQNAADGTNSPFDSHSVTVSSDALGTFVFAGHGGSSAASALDTTAAGDMWDNFDGEGVGADAVAVSDSSPGNNSMFYTLPSMVDGLAVSASYKPRSTGRASATGFAGTYTGVEGLSVSYGVTDIETGVSTTSGDQTVMKASYAYGPVTVAYSNSDYDIASTANNNSDQETTSYNISYTVSDAISVSYGREEISSGAASTVDAEYDGFKASYTSGGMTVSASMMDGDNTTNTTASDEDMEYWSLGLSFAF
jgi:outer membrane protein OmpU